MDITPIINAVITLAAAVITAFVIPWIKSRTTAAQRNEIEAWVKIAVTAAEQIFKETGTGQQKKEYVLQFLADKNLEIDMKSLDLMIESAVISMNEAWVKEQSENKTICIMCGKVSEDA